MHVYNVYSEYILFVYYLMSAGIFVPSLSQINVCKL